MENREKERMKMKSIIRSFVLISTIAVSSTMIPQEPGKCSPCQAAKSIRDALAQSIKDAAAAVLAAGGAFSREKELDIAVEAEKCGCSRTTRDELAANISNEAEKCGCSRTTRDQLASRLNADAALTVPACCEFCAQPGSLGCQGINSARCNTCQQGLVKMSLAEAAAQILGSIQDAAKELDDVTDVSRAPREELVDPCNICGPQEEVDPCALQKQLNAIRCCCSSVAQTITCQGKKAEKCCRHLKHKIDDVQDVLGDPAQWPMNIPLCQPDISTVVSGIEADVITWLKSIYVLLYTVHQCNCCPGPVA